MLKFLCHIIRISIHAPTRGATKAKCSFKRPRTFQSTLLQEERQFKTSPFSRHHDFNPRSYKRSDADICVKTSLSSEFQSTLLQEERLSITVFFCNFTYFNPRSYKRSDDIIGCSILTHINFNPRSYKRSDKLAYKLRMQNKISIHAPTRGATLSGKGRVFTFFNFNPRSYKRSDSKNAQYSLCISAIIIA